MVTALAFLILSALASVHGLPISSFKGSSVLQHVPLVDGHNDLPWNMRELVRNHLSQVDLTKNLTGDPVWGCDSCFTDIPRLRAGRVGAQFWAAYVPCSSQYKDAVEMTFEQIDVIKRMADAYPNDFQFATRADDIMASFHHGRIASLIGVEGGHSMDNRLGVLRELYNMGVRYMTLTHNCNTPWADSSFADVDGPEHDGLSPFGELVVKEMNRLGMMLDLSHVSAQTQRDAISVSRAPVMYSHSSAYALCNHHRNVRDDVLKLVAQNGGVVMVNFYEKFILCDSDRRATLEDVVAHINHIRNVAGVDHVGIGGDYDGVNLMPVGLEDVSKYVDLFDRLAASKEGEPRWTSEDLGKLAGNNIIRVFKGVEKVMQQMAEESVSPVEDWLSAGALGSNTQCRTDLDLMPQKISSLFQRSTNNCE